MGRGCWRLGKSNGFSFWGVGRVVWCSSRFLRSGLALALALGLNPRSCDRTSLLGFYEVAVVLLPEHSPRLAANVDSVYKATACKSHLPAIISVISGVALHPTIMRDSLNINRGHMLYHQVLGLLVVNNDRR